MKIFDCFQFFDEEMLLDLRLNMLDKYVDKFVIVEATYKHNGEPKKLIFDIKKFAKFKDKIKYIIADNPYENLLKSNQKDNEELKESKKILNAYRREGNQVQKIIDGIKDADPEDIIIMSDLDEIPNLEEIDFEKINNKLIFFKQKMFYYKLNLFYAEMPWYGTKACKKKYFKSPQWIRWIKNKKYPIWRLDIIFSEKKYNDIYYVDNGGWHFTNINSPENIERKLLSFVHHHDFEKSGIKLNDLKKIINEKKVMYDHSKDKKSAKWVSCKKLETLSIDKMPKYISQNLTKYRLWLDLTK